MATEPVADKRIWIIGASHGIGEKLAHELAAAGATIIASGREKAKLITLCRALAGEDHMPLPLDVQNEEQLHEALRQIVQHYGELDTVIYMAGIYEPAPAWDFDLKTARDTIHTNLSGVFTLLSAVVPEFLRQRHGHIVLTGSIVGYRGLPEVLAYGASKAAVIHLAETLSIDLAERNIRVQVINPGFVRTRLTDKTHQPLPCMISAQEAAVAVRKGLESSRFEIHFPARVSWPFKLLRIVPFRLYRWLVNRWVRKR